MEEGDPIDLADLNLKVPQYEAPIPHVCNRAVAECKHLNTCLNKKYQSIPSCKRAKLRCSENPIAEQVLWPFCQSCLDAGRDIRMCSFESIQCANSQEACFKVRQKLRGPACESSPKPRGPWSVAALRDVITDQDCTDECSAALMAEITAYEEMTKAQLRTWTKAERRERA
eukprot:CAMPEP_0118955432 /NCGR_PEP_ID=MMETSP1169-20130426/59955_1 /TAXON_ID=36882 /ORGANISM="Pyramimonas obovata, Strain CCMP722" /LENGTH=170 /DNA_ID=CAMNT_0006903277 /DNA_START=186 /DNA_END=694 /DNA_ORIENTATION=+